MVGWVVGGVLVMVVVVVVWDSGPLVCAAREYPLSPVTGSCSDQVEPLRPFLVSLHEAAGPVGPSTRWNLNITHVPAEK